MTKHEAFNYALKILSPYIKRGDTYDQTRSGQMGYSSSDEPIFQIGGYSFNLKKQYSSHKVIITDKEEEFVFNLKEFYDYLLSPQKKLL